MASQLFLYASHVIPIGVLWLSIVFELIPLYDGFPSFINHIIFYLPFYAVIGLGIYAVGSVVRGVMSFSDCPEAKEELIQEIKDARKELKEKAIID